MKNIKTSFKYTLYSLMMLLIIFCGATCLWIILTDYEWGQYKLVLSLILKNAGGYSVLLVALVITICLQIYTKERDLAKENQIKIKEVGYYTLAFSLNPTIDDPVFVGDRQVTIISKKEDYFSQENINKIPYRIKFLTSKKKTVNLKNVMAFDDSYFRLHGYKIRRKYFDFCEKVHYVTPLYCAAKPTSELVNNNEADRTRYFWLMLDKNELIENETVEKDFWVSAVTEEGILLFIKVRARIEWKDNNIRMVLLQQTTYYKSQNKLCPLYG